jgi:hypothetical protein
LQIIIGMAGKPHEHMNLYRTCTVVLGLIICAAFVLSIVQLVKGKLARELEIATTVALLGYVIGCTLHWDFQPLSVFPQYMFMLPTFMNSFSIFSFCNMHDVSWGTKEGNSANQAVFVQKRPHEAELLAAGNEELRKKILAEEAALKAEEERRKAAVRVCVSRGDDTVPDVELTVCIRVIVAARCRTSKDRVGILKLPQDAVVAVVAFQYWPVCHHFVLRLPVQLWCGRRDCYQHHHGHADHWCV